MRPVKFVLVLVAGCGRFGFDAAGTPGVDAAADPDTPTGQLCGDHILVAPEQCDVGDVVDGDGCSASCQIEPGYLCTEVSCTPAGGTTASAGVLLPPVGGTAGTEFARECPQGSVLVGFTTGTAEGGLTRMAAACAPLTFGLEGQAVLGATSFTDPEGSAVPTGEGNAICPAGSVVTGHIGESTNTGVVGGIAVACRTLAVLGGELVFGPVVQSDPIGTLGATPDEKACEPGSVARGWAGRADTVVVQTTVRCDPIAATPCGNGVLDAGEGCDDGNMVNGDGCSAACLVE